MLPTIPDLLVTLLREQYGSDEAERVTAGYVRRAVTLRVNTLRSTLADVTTALTAAGIAWQPVPWYADALILPEAREEALRAQPLGDLCREPRAVHRERGNFNQHLLPPGTCG